MAYNEKLAQSVRDCLPALTDLREMKMFGGLAFLTRGNMGVAVVTDGLMVRVSREDYERTLAESRARPVEMGGRTMRGFVRIQQSDLEGGDELRRWVERGMHFAASLPPR